MGALSSAVPSWGPTLGSRRCLHTCHLRPARHYLWCPPPPEGTLLTIALPGTAVRLDECGGWTRLGGLSTGLPYRAARLRLHSAGSTLPHLWPTGSSWGRPLDYGPVLLRKPFGPHLTVGALSSAVPSWRLQVHLGCVQLSPACPFRYLHTCHLRPARHYPRLWIRPPSSGGRRDFNPPDQCAAWRTLLPHPTSSFLHLTSSFPLRPRSDSVQVPTKDVRTCMGSSTPWRSPHRGGDVGVAFDGARSARPTDLSMSPARSRPCQRRPATGE